MMHINSIGFTIYPPHGSLSQGMMLHLYNDPNLGWSIDINTLNYVKAEMEANAVSGTPIFVSVNTDPRNLPAKLLRRLRYGKVLFVLGPNDEDNQSCSQQIWIPDDEGHLSDDDSDTNSLTGDDINDVDEDVKRNASDEKKILNLISCSDAQVFNIFEEELRWEQRSF